MQQISRWQLILLGAGYMFDVTLMTLPAQMIEVARQDAWIGYLIAALLALVPLVLLTRSNQRFPGRSLIESLPDRAPTVGRIALCLYLLLFLYIFARDLRMVVDFVNIALLPQTPLPVIALLIVLAVIPFVRPGIEVLARVNEFFFMILVTAVLAIPLLTLKEMNMEEFYPMLEFGLGPSTESGWYAFPFLSEGMMLPLIFSSRNYNLKRGVTAVAISTLLLMVLITTNLTVLGVEVSARFMYPHHELVRQIRVTDFLDRFDLIIVSFWLPAVIVKIGMSLHLIIRIMHAVVPRAKMPQLAAPACFFGLASSFAFFRNALDPINMNFVWPMVCLFHMIVLPLLIFLFLRPRGERTQEPT